MRLNSMVFLVREALSGLWRHGIMTLAAISTSTVSFTVLGAFLVVLFLLNSVSASMLSQLGIAVFMTRQSDRADTLRVRNQIQALPGVSSVTVVTKEQAWSRMKKDLGKYVPLDGVKENRLSDEIRILTTDVEHITPVANAVTKIKGVDEAVVVTSIVKKMQQTVRLLRTLMSGAAVLLLLATLSMITNVIRLTVFARRREIKIMQMVGATNAFIRTPFLLEGLIYGAVGGALAAWLVSRGGASLIQFVHEQLPFLPVDPFTIPLTTMVLAFAGTGALLGLLGSFGSIRRFLNASS